MLVDLKEEALSMSNIRTTSPPPINYGIDRKSSNFQPQNQENELKTQNQDQNFTSKEVNYKQNYSDGEEEYEGEEEEEEIQDYDEVIMKKCIDYFELTRRAYINLFNTVITNQPEMLDKINLKLLQIIMAKENKIEEFLGTIDANHDESVIKDYFLDSYAFEKKSKKIPIFFIFQ